VVHFRLFYLLLLMEVGGNDSPENGQIQLLSSLLPISKG
jgi:hypothetical protein